MYIHSLIRFFLRVLIPLSLISTLYLYLYPVFKGCAFPSPNGSPYSSFLDTATQHLPFDSSIVREQNLQLAPFRLLVLADPQLEGDSSLPSPEDFFWNRLQKHWNRVDRSNERYTTAVKALKEVIQWDIPRAAFTLRKQLDLFGNDYYLAHIYRSLFWWSKPTHVTVLGDLIGSQWVNDDEFDWRGWRYWNRVFLGGQRVEDEVMSLSEGEKEKILQMDDISWKRRVINIAGNHDIGYAGDISPKRMERFERVFGKANWDVRFEYPVSANRNISTEEQPPTLHMIILNSLNLDTPALSQDLQAGTYAFVNSVVSTRSRPVEDRSSFTLLLTHLPLHKEAGICVDGPHVDFFGHDNGGGAYLPRGIKEQNHLSKGSSQPGTLESLFGMHGNIAAPAQGKGRNGLILNGHDHEGCDTFHFIPANTTWNSNEGEEDRKIQWDTVRWGNTDTVTSHTGVREITLRSMMGEFSGNAGLLSAWFDFDLGEWKYEYQNCSFGVQHIWWAVHVLDLVTIILMVLFGLVNLLITPRQSQPRIHQEKKYIQTKGG